MAGNAPVSVCVGQTYNLSREALEAKTEAIQTEIELFWFFNGGGTERRLGTKNK